MNNDDFREIRKLVAWILFGAVSFVVVGAILLKQHERVPTSFQEAGLVGHPWSTEQINLARRVTHLRLRLLTHQLEDADARGDAKQLGDIVPHLTETLRVWNQQSEAIGTEGRDCVLAALHMSNGVTEMLNGATWNRSRFDLCMQRCKP